MAPRPASRSPRCWHRRRRLRSRALRSPRRPSGSEFFYDTDTGSGSVEVQGTVTGATAGAKADLLCYVPGKSAPLVLASGIGRRGGDVRVRRLAQAGRYPGVPARARPRGHDAHRQRRRPVCRTIDQRHRAAVELVERPALRLLHPQRQVRALGRIRIGRRVRPAGLVLDRPGDAAQLLAVRSQCLPVAGGAGGPGATRSALQIDGQNAYLPGAVGPTFDSTGKVTSPGLTAQPGFMPLTYTATFDAAHETVTIDDTEPAMICDPPATLPAQPSHLPIAARFRRADRAAHDAARRRPRRPRGADRHRRRRTQPPDRRRLPAFGRRPDEQRGAGLPVPEPKLAGHARDAGRIQRLGSRSAVDLRDPQRLAGAGSEQSGGSDHVRPRPENRHLRQRAPARPWRRWRWTTATPLPAGGALAYHGRSRRRPAPRRRRCSRPASATRSRHRRSRSAPPPAAPRTRAPAVLVQGSAGDAVGVQAVSGQRPPGVDRRPAVCSRSPCRWRSASNTLTARAVNDGGNAATASISVIRLRADASFRACGAARCVGSAAAGPRPTAGPGASCACARPTSAAGRIVSPSPPPAVSPPGDEGPPDPQRRAVAAPQPPRAPGQGHAGHASGGRGAGDRQRSPSAGGRAGRSAAPPSPAPGRSRAARGRG